jgi:hypothetical protein
MTEETFICKSCGSEVFQSSLSSLAEEISCEEGVCFLCNWINTNSKLTEKEREELRERFRLKMKTHGL